METVAFHPDGLILATGMEQGAVAVWDVKSQSCVTQFEGHAGAVKSLAFSENGFVMASGSMDGTVKVWDLRNGACLQTLAMEAPVHAVAFDYSGVYLGAGAEELRVFNSKSWSPVWSCKEEVGGYHSLVFGDSAQYLFAGCGNRSVVKFCNWFVCW